VVHLVEAQGRQGEFSVLRHLGCSVRESLALIAMEGILTLFMGLLFGVAVGTGLSQIMIPYLSQSLSESLGGLALEIVTLDWSAVARLFLLLVLLYGSALLLLLLVLIRTRVHWNLWTGDD
jgi:putative ABC transport system permease protein